MIINVCTYEGVHVCVIHYTMYLCKQAYIMCMCHTWVFTPKHTFHYQGDHIQQMLSTQIQANGWILWSRLI